MTADEIRKHVRDFMQHEKARDLFKSAPRIGFCVEGIRDGLRHTGRTVEDSEIISALSDPAFEALVGLKLIEVKAVLPNLTSVRFERP